MAVPFSDLQAIAPSSVIELFELELNQKQHGATDIYRFHAGSNLNANGELVWAGNTYLRYPVEAEGFEYSGKGSLPRPKLRVSNIMGTITALLLTLPSGIEGAKVTRIRTLARYIDAVNFPGNVNPYGTPDSTVAFPPEIYYIDRRSSETRDVVEFELASSFDLVGVRGPKRQCISAICQWEYRSAECSWVPMTSTTATYSRTGTTLTVSKTNHGLAAGAQIYLVITSGAALSGSYAIVTSATNSFTVTTAASGSTSGNVTLTQWYDTTDTFKTTASADVCSKRLDSCKIRFGATNQLPFGSFPGVGSFYS